MADLRDKILDALETLEARPELEPTVRRITRHVFGQWWNFEDEKVISCVVADMVAQGQLRWSGINIYRKGV